MVAADFEFVLHCIAEDESTPVNTDRGNHACDAATINWYCERASSLSAVPEVALLDTGPVS